MTLGCQVGELKTNLIVAEVGTQDYGDTPENKATHDRSAHPLSTAALPCTETHTKECAAEPAPVAQSTRARARASLSPGGTVAASR